jgi:hypothetical protein
MCSYAHSSIEIHHLNFSSRNMVLILDWWVFQRQRKAWHIPSPKNLTWWPWPLTYDLENHNISWRPISPISKPYFVKKSSNGEFLCLNAKRIWKPIDFQGQRSRGQIFETIQYALCHRKFSYMINQKFMKLCSFKFHKHLIKHVGGVVMTKCMVNCLKISKSKKA